MSFDIPRLIVTIPSTFLWKFIANSSMASIREAFKFHPICQPSQRPHSSVKQTFQHHDPKFHQKLIELVKIEEFPFNFSSQNVAILSAFFAKGKLLLENFSSSSLFEQRKQTFRSSMLHRWDFKCCNLWPDRCDSLPSLYWFSFSFSISDNQLSFRG